MRCEGNPAPGVLCKSDKERIYACNSVQEYQNKDFLNLNNNLGEIAAASNKGQIKELKARLLGSRDVLITRYRNPSTTAGLRGCVV
jgi:hypothetical protein